MQEIMQRIQILSYQLFISYDIIYHRKNILEDIDLLLIDEAHEISNVATDVFTLELFG